MRAEDGGRRTEGGKPAIAVVDYRAGNLTSVLKGLTAAGARGFVTDDAAAIAGADAVVVPGVGHFAATAAISAGMRGALRDAVEARRPLLGVCLGLQAIVRAFGGAIVRGPVVHGKTSTVTHDGTGVFDGVANPFDAMRYHSLVADRNAMPDALVVTAWTDDGTVMGIRHVHLPIEGVQFHPESILTPEGTRLLRNLVDAATARRR